MFEKSRLKLWKNICCCLKAWNSGLLIKTSDKSGDELNRIHRRISSFWLYIYWLVDMRIYRHNAVDDDGAMSPNQLVYCKLTDGMMWCFLLDSSIYCLLHRLYIYKYICYIQKKNMVYVHIYCILIYSEYILITLHCCEILLSHLIQRHYCCLCKTKNMNYLWPGSRL